MELNYYGRDLKVEDVVYQQMYKHLIFGLGNSGPRKNRLDADLVHWFWAFILIGWKHFNNQSVCMLKTNALNIYLALI